MNHARHKRNFVYFIVGVLLSAWAIIGHAATSYRATTFVNLGGGATFTNNLTGAATTKCGYYGKTLSHYAVGASSGDLTSYCNPGGASVGDNPINFTCPQGGTRAPPYSETMLCTGAPDCPAGKFRDLAGACQPDCVLPQVYDSVTRTCAIPPLTCSGNQHANETGTACVCDITTPATVSYTVSASATNKGPPTCNNGCEMSADGAWGLPIYVGSYNLAGITNIATATLTMYARTGQTGAICSSSATGNGQAIQITLAPLTATGAPAGTNASGAVDPMSTAGNNADPLSCGASGGTYQVVGGVGYCGTSSPVTPSITSSKQIATASNPVTGQSQQTTTTTTTTCVGAGACSSTSTSTITSGGVTVGSKTGTGSGTTPADAGAAANNAEGPLAKSDLPTDYQRDSTGLALNQKVDKIISVLGDPVADDSSITNSTHSPASQTALTAIDDNVKAAVEGTENSAVLAQVSIWDQTMSTGWWTPIPQSSCSAFTATIGGNVWTLDICPTAAKIAEIGAYVMWIFLMFSAFRMLTTFQSVEAR